MVDGVATMGPFELISDRLGPGSPSLSDLLQSGLLFEVRQRGTASPPSPGFTAVDVSADPTTAAAELSKLPKGVDALFLRGLERFSDYRSLLQACFGRLRIGGYLFIEAPHQFLYERKLQLPSRYHTGVRRFYTPGALLREIEEALDGCEFRLRTLYDDDRSYDYRAPLDQRASGSSSIVAALERIGRPDWADAMYEDGLPVARPINATRVLPLEPAEHAPYHIVTSAIAAVNRIVVLKLDHRGDYILARQAFTDLRKAYPCAEITLVCGSWNAADARNSDLFDEVIPFDFFMEDNSEGRRDLSDDDLFEQFGALMVDREFDVAIDLRLFEDTRRLLDLLNATHKAGFDRRNEFPWLDIPFNMPFSTREGRGEQGFVSARHIDTRRGAHLFYAIDFEGEPLPGAGECLVSGGYITLTPGDYLIGVHFEAAPGRSCTLGYDVCYDLGRQRLLAGFLTFKPGIIPSFHLMVPDLLEQVEVRLFSTNANNPFGRYLGFSHRRRGEIVGLHQIEAMSLLVKLVNLRLASPFAAEKDA